jgi:hypothetical protein
VTWAPEKAGTANRLQDVLTDGRRYASRERQQTLTEMPILKRDIAQTRSGLKGFFRQDRPFNGFEANRRNGLKSANSGHSPTVGERLLILKAVIQKSCGNRRAPTHYGHSQPCGPQV